MLITSPNRKTTLRIERCDTDEYLAIEVKVAIEDVRLSTEASFFTAQQFLAELAEFERTRRGTATLDEPGVMMVIEPLGPTGAAWLRFRVCRFIPIMDVREEVEPTGGTITVESAFPIPGEMIGQLLHEFRAVFAIEFNA
jgi:hypothetical protein